MLNIDKRIIENYKLSLTQKYNAVCFDIDGTLTENNSKKIDMRAIEMIANLLRRKIPVVFITGRGENGLHDLKNDIYQPLKDSFGINNNEFSRMYILTNDGARLFSTPPGEKEDIFTQSQYISTAEELKALEIIEKSILRYFNSKFLNRICNISYSKDLQTNITINIRIVFETNNNELINAIFDIIENVIKENGVKSIYITREIYKDKNVIQLGTARKDIAIERVEQIIGVPKNSMIRVGDCGDIRGDDYSMLNCEQGYSVDKTSNSINSCFPIFNDNGEILKGVEATLYLIKKAKILPTICLERASKEKYILDYANVEKKIIIGRNNHLKYFNEIINTNFNLIEGINDLFDKYSGSIKIPMYEWELIKNSPLKNFWSKREEEKLTYVIRDDNNYLLRGSKTYYYLLANRESNNGSDKTLPENILEWYCNYLLFFKEAISAISNTDEIQSSISKKLIIGIFDNIRNILLIIINHKIYSEFLNQNIILRLNSNDNSAFNSLYHTILIVEEIMGSICFKKNYILDKKQIINIVQIVYSEIYQEFLNTKNNLKDIDYSKEYRAYRELDNFAENYITLALNNAKESSFNDTSVCGLSYGGIELPILYKTINKNVKDVLILKFNKQVSGYANKQLIDIRKFNIKEYGGIDGIEKLKNERIVLLDDNILTGKTLQLAITALYDYNLITNNIIVVRYPSINRVDQMFMKNHGAIDYSLFFNFITGLCFSSPYSWRDENELNPYEDSLGVFDLNRKK